MCILEAHAPWRVFRDSPTRRGFREAAQAATGPALRSVDNLHRNCKADEMDKKEEEIRQQGGLLLASASRFVTRNVNRKLNSKDLVTPRIRLHTGSVFSLMPSKTQKTTFSRVAGQEENRVELKHDVNRDFRVVPTAG